MSYSIVIPSRNAANVKACVGAIRACGETARVLVVDDDIDFNDWECRGLLRDDFQRLGMRIFQGAKPFCFSRNVNIGIRAAGNDDVVLLNDDALLATGHGFSMLAEAADRHQYVGVWSAAVMGSVVNPVHMHVPGLQRTDIWRTAGKMVPFVAVYIRRAVLDGVGLLDERFGGSMYRPTINERGSILGGGGLEQVYGGEDDDYCYRVRAAGLKVAVHNGCVVEHGTLPSTFRPDGKGRSMAGARAKFEQIHGFPMGSR